MNLLEELKRINPDIVEFIQQEILDNNGNIVGSRCYGINKSGDSFSGGTAASKDTALRVAIAEAFERSLFYRVLDDEKLKQDFDLVNYPSTSGFAAGFDDKPTRFRAICEGLERWAWSKWIDEHFKIEEDKTQKKLSNLTSHLLNDFIDNRWFRKELEVEISPKEKIKLSLVIFLGLTDNGVFPGSRVSTKSDDLYEHPVIEAHRNLINFKLNNEDTASTGDIIEQRTMYFGQNKKLALEQIETASKNTWPLPKLSLLKNFETNIPEVFLYRCLFKDFIGWHTGTKERFVY